MVAGKLDGGGVGDRLVGVSAITADVGAVVVLAAVPVPASALVAVVAMTVVIALTPAALGAAVVLVGGCFSAVAATPVIF